MNKIPPFVRKLRAIVKEPTIKGIVNWDEKSCVLTILKPEDFSIKILPFYFKHCNFSSFVRQLNLYGFHKIDSQLWMFRHEKLTTSLFSGSDVIIRKKRYTIKNDFNKNISIENRINEIKIFVRRMFIFLTRILDLFVQHHDNIRTVVNLVKILSFEIHDLRSNISKINIK